MVDLERFPLEYLYFHVTDGCNLFCKHCWLSAGKHSTGSQLGVERCVSLAEQGVDLGLKNVKLSGGEPLLVPWFKEGIVRLAQMASIMVETNGTLVDSETAGLLAKNNVAVSVSLDGATAESHEWLRGVKGSFAGALNGIKLLTSAGCKVQIITCIHERNIGELEKIVQLCAELKVENMKLNPVVSLGRARTNSLGFANPTGLLSLVASSEALSKKYGIEIDPDVPWAYYPLSRLSGLGVCHFLNLLTVLPSGQLSLCAYGQSREDLIVSRKDDERLAEVWTNNGLLEKAREAITEDLRGVCASCIFKTVCRGGCRIPAIETYGSVSEAHPYCQALYDAGLFPASRLIEPVGASIRTN